MWYGQRGARVDAASDVRPANVREGLRGAHAEIEAVSASVPLLKISEQFLKEERWQA